MANAEMRETVDPIAVEEIHHWMQFELEDPYVDQWNPAHPKVQAGSLVVIQSPLQKDRDGGRTNRILFAGDRVAEPLNPGTESGVVVVIVPLVGESSIIPMWYGSRALPEQLVEGDISGEVQRAHAGGIRGVSAPIGASVSARPAQRPRSFADKSGLLRAAAELIRRYAPEDEAIAAGFTINERHVYPGR